MRSENALGSLGIPFPVCILGYIIGEGISEMNRYYRKIPLTSHDFPFFALNRINMFFL